MNAGEIAKIIKMFEEANISHLDLEMDNIKIKLDKQMTIPASTPQANIPASNEMVMEKINSEDSNYVTSPLVGTFYRAPSVDSKPFVNVGDKVKKGDKLCIVEAMKVMNEIISPYDGVVKEIYSDNEAMVEYGANLFRIGE